MFYRFISVFFISLLICILPTEIKASGYNLQEYKSPLLVFVSSSMPKTSLIQLGKDVAKLDGILVFRGLINNSFTNTTKFMQEIGYNKVNTIIDPKLFSLFAIKQIPTFIVLSSNTNLCPDYKCDATPIYDFIQGNITLNYALTKIAEDGDFAKENAQTLVMRLK